MIRREFIFIIHSDIGTALDIQLLFIFMTLLCVLIWITSLLGFIRYPSLVLTLSDYLFFISATYKFMIHFTPYCITGLDLKTFGFIYG